MSDLVGDSEDRFSRIVHQLWVTDDGGSQHSNLGTIIDRTFKQCGYITILYTKFIYDDQFCPC